MRAAGDGERASPAFCCGAGKGVLGAFADGGAQFPRLEEIPQERPSLFTYFQGGEEKAKKTT